MINPQPRHNMVLTDRGLQEVCCVLPRLLSDSWAISLLNRLFIIVYTPRRLSRCCGTLGARFRHRCSFVPYLPLCHSYPHVPPIVLSKTAYESFIENQHGLQDRKYPLLRARGPALHPTVERRDQNATRRSPKTTAQSFSAPLVFWIQVSRNRHLLSASVLQGACQDLFVIPASIETLSIYSFNNKQTYIAGCIGHP